MGVVDVHYMKVEHLDLEDAVGIVLAHRVVLRVLNLVEVVQVEEEAKMEKGE